MIRLTIIVTLISHLSSVISTETTDIHYNLTDFTKRNTLIGNLIYSKTNQKSDMTSESFFLIDVHKIFTLKSNGDLYTNDDIDRDQICLKYSCCKNYICTLNVKAHLMMNTVDSFNIIINIIDDNDNRPEFLTSLSTVSVPESAELQSTFKLPVAVDRDSEIYGIDGYKLVDATNTFQNIMINNEPYLKVLKHLDREKLDNYNIQLLAYDKNPFFLTSTLSLKIKITDVNDNAPYFIQKNDNKLKMSNLSDTYKLDFMESQPGTHEIYTFYAEDKDEGDNAKITYTISSTLSHPSDTVQQKFSLQSPDIDAKIILRQSLDYEIETERVISLVIVATDHGKPAKSASISLSINVIDINDNPPVITESSSKDISENNSEKQKLKIFTVSDKDVISNKKIDCVLSEEMSSQFILEKYDWNFYALFNKIAFDYETRTREIIRIVCTDRAEPEIVQNTDFYVNIKDENDNVPQWDKSEYYINIYENNIKDLIVGTISAKDADSSMFGKLYYNISGSSVDSILSYVKVDHHSGLIQMTRSVDREEFSHLEYNVTVTDNYNNHKDLSNKLIKHSNLTKLIIKIMDVNDNIPQFKGDVKHFKISESSPIDTVVGKVYFDDKDEFPNNMVLLSLLDYDTRTQRLSQSFGIIDQNTIVVKSSLDREEMGNVSLFVQAVDKGNPSQTGRETILIEILDVNDNYPFLSNPQNNSFISGEGVQQSTDYNTPLIQLKVTDLDAGLNGSIIFKILNSNLTNQNDIKIDEVTGDISTNWRNLLSPDIGIYVINVLISDKGSPPLSTHISLFVNITNNNPHNQNEGYMSNIVILILIIVCSLALIVSLIAAIFWVRFRVSNEFPVNCHEEYFEREHLNKEINSLQYSLIPLDKSFRQNTYENNRNTVYDTYQGFHPDPCNQTLNHSNYSHNIVHDVTEKSIMAPCEDLPIYGTVPGQCNRFYPSISRIRHPVIPVLNNSLNGNLITANPGSFVQSCCENDYKTAANIHPTALMLEPNFSDSGKGGSVEDLNYRQFTGISTFTSSSFINTSTTNAKLFGPNSNLDSNVGQCLYDKGSETMF